MSKPVENRPHCPVCGGTLVYRIRTKDYRCMSCPNITPLSSLTPLQPIETPGKPPVPAPLTGGIPQ